MKIALCMIVRNEERSIRKAIESALSVIDEAVILIDDRTNDNTEEEVISALSSFDGQKTIRKFTWEDDFSKARNEALSLVKSDYVLILDGHNYIDESTTPYFEEMKRNLDTETDIYYLLTYEKNYGHGGIERMQPRLFKSSLRYRRGMHNVLEYKEGLKERIVPQIKIWHNQPQQLFKFRKKQRRNMANSSLLDSHRNGDAQSKFYIAQTKLENEQYKEAIEDFREYIQKSKWQMEKYKARLMLSDALLKTGAKESAKEELMKCFSDDVCSNTHLINLGDIYFGDAQYRVSANFYRMATAILKPFNHKMEIQTHDYTWLPWFKLAKCYLMLNDVDGVRECIRQGKVLGAEIHDFYVMEKSLNGVLKNREKFKNGKIYIVCSSPRFVKEVCAELSENYHVVIENKLDSHKAADADIIFCEWADHNAIAISHCETKAEKVLRVHSYEVYNEHFRNQVDWLAFDKIIFVADHVAQYLTNAIGGEEALHIAKVGETIHNWVDFDRFSIPDAKKQNNKIAYAGNFNEIKGIRFMLFLASELPGYEFHLAGKWQQEDLKRLALEKKPPNVFFYKWQDNLNHFFSDKSYLLSTSLREGCPVALIEAMSAGLTPLIYNWVGSRDLFEEKYIWSTIEELKQVLALKWSPGNCRTYARSKFGKENLNKVIEIVSTLINEKKNESKSSEILRSIPR